jgi:hypothetical protein
MWRRCMKFNTLFDIFFLLFIASTTFMAQNEPTDHNEKAAASESSFDIKDSAIQAAAIVDRAIRACGGDARLDALKSIRLDFDAAGLGSTRIQWLQSHLGINKER